MAEKRLLGKQTQINSQLALKNHQSQNLWYPQTTSLHEEIWVLSNNPHSSATLNGRHKNEGAENNFYAVILVILFSLWC